MRIGIDFDNTIACYDNLFHKVALEQKLIPESVPVNKVAVRDYLRLAGKEPVWTELQGYVYGKRMNEANSFPGVVEFIMKALKQGNSVTIISHKTRHPVIGPRYDLHEAARSWIAQNLIWNGRQLLSSEELFFELTREEKIKRIMQIGCEIFIDDLPEVLFAPNFPANTGAILFDPEGNHDIDNMPLFTSWKDIMAHLGVHG